MSGLLIEGLTVSYGRRRIVEGLGLPPLMPGEITVLAGPNAAGKSTLLSLCGAREHPTAGEVHVLGHRLDGQRVCQDMADHGAEIDARKASIRPDQTAMMVFTSGSTGLPKAAEISHSNLYVASTQAAKIFAGFSPGTNILSYLPLCHIAERMGGEYFSLYTGARLNFARISTQDLTGFSPDVNGTHYFNKINPVAGLAYRFLPELTLYGGYSESNRAPTPLELACANPDRPCLLPNSLVADPPLKQVTGRTYEAGFRGVIPSFLSGGALT